MSKFVKETLVPVLGFGVGGALWGWQAYSLIDPNEIHVSPFSFILGAVFLGIFGSGSLVIFSGDWKKILKVTGVGMIGWVAAFTFLGMWEYWLWLGGGLLLAIILSPFSGMKFGGEFLIDSFVGNTSLEPNLQIVNFWIEFLFLGTITAFLFAVIFRRRIIRAVFCGALGFVAASIFAPIIGNLVTNLFPLLFTVYLITFTLIGAIFGFALVWGLRGNAEAT